jgi:thiamine pyrophosphate-dependent acetolactate synthase large subunit-like protein
VRVRFLGAGEKTLSLSHVQLEVVTKAEADRLRQELRSAPPPHVPGPDPENLDAERAFELLQGKEPCVFITGFNARGKVATRARQKLATRERR